MLLRHASESLAAIGEGIEAGRVGLHPAAEDGDLAADPAEAFRDRAGQLLDAWTSLGHRRQAVEIAGCPLAASVMAAAAALEVAVHGWDINQACGQRQPIPRALATALLEIALVLVPSTGRYPLFAAPVTVPATAAPSDRLAAFLGRTPRHSARIRGRSAPRCVCPRLSHAHATGLAPWRQTDRCLSQSSAACATSRQP